MGISDKRELPIKLKEQVKNAAIRLICFIEID